MKGKGKAIATKGKHRENEREKDKERELREREADKDNGDLSDSKDCPLQFPDFTSVDHSRSCPRYSSILQRSEEDSVGLEDFDSLQLELELLLSSVTQRMKQLDTEMKILISWQEKKDVKKPINKLNSVSPGKRGKVQESKPTKKFRGETSTGKTGGSQVGPGRPKTKNIKQDLDSSDTSVEAPRVPKNDVPNRFWASIEPYCADITPEDIKIIEDLVKSHEEDSEYYKIPGLGKHYSIKWAQEDLIEEQKESGKDLDKRRGLNNSSLNPLEADRIMKKAEKECDGDASPFGALTQRLVACLIEENIMSPMDETLTELPEGTVSNLPLTRSSLMKSLNISNTSQLERRIKRELEEQGILEAEDNILENPEDEILAELRKCQSELKTVTSHSLQIKRKLLKLAKEELTKQELRKKLAISDNEIIETYKRFATARQKKRTPTKKEKEQGWRLLRERENILKALAE
ncbi:transcriptional adaptor 3 [Chamberlinius hualienensis]